MHIPTQAALGVLARASKARLRGLKKEPPVDDGDEGNNEASKGIKVEEGTKILAAELSEGT